MSHMEAVGRRSVLDMGKQSAIMSINLVSSHTPQSHMFEKHVRRILWYE